ncbi:MAG: polysaccharide biosynthesis protein, partial [Candidatus Nucleicultricaceae bacterium]
VNTLSHNRSFIILLHDLFMTCLALPLALWLRVGDDIVNYPATHIIVHTAILGFIALGVFLWTQLYRGVWRYVSLNELIAIMIAVTGVILLYLPLLLLLTQPVSMPRSLIGLVWGLMIIFLGGSRFAYRIFRNRMEAQANHQFSPVPQSRVLLVGVNNQTELFIREVEHNAQSPYEIVGIIDDRKHDVGRYIHGIEVMGRIEDLPRIVAHLNAQGAHPHHLVITNPDFKGPMLQKILDLSANLNVDLARIPKLTDLNKTNPHSLDIKPISVEDLLGREQIALDRKSMKAFIQKRRVLVTGAGGTIGGELLRQVAAFDPSHITIVDHSEFLLYNANLDITEHYPDLSIKPVLMDVSDTIRVQKVIQEEKPDIIFHAAALKHVPIAEQNPNEAILTNVVGTRNIAEAARANKVKAMVFISTDKAVNPSSIMGASKRLSESLCQSLDSLNKEKSSTRYVIVRFGNVLGSTGSVVPLFTRQLQKGGPLTVTDPRVTRYFMTTHEAIELVLQAAALGFKSAKTTGQIFVLDMGKSIKIDDLARQMIRLAGYKPDEDIKIEYTGLRGGEKLHEELFFNSENLQPTTCEGLMLATTEIDPPKRLLSRLDVLEEHARLRDSEKSLSLLKELVPEYATPKVPMKKK